MNLLFDISEVSVGKHWFWQIGGYEAHGQVLVMSWVVFSIIALLAFCVVRMYGLKNI